MGGKRECAFVLPVEAFAAAVAAAAVAAVAVAGKAGGRASE